MTSVEIPLDDESLPPLPNWQDQDDLLRELWQRNLPPQAIAEQLNRSVAAVMTRAVRLGLPRRAAPGRKPGSRLPDASRKTSTSRRRAAPPAAEEETVIPAPAERICLMCLTRFASVGRHNRICPRCKESAEYTAACSVPDINFRTQA